MKFKLIVAIAICLLVMFNANAQQHKKHKPAAYKTSHSKKKKSSMRMAHRKAKKGPSKIAKRGYACIERSSNDFSYHAFPSSLLGRTKDEYWEYSLTYIHS